MPAHVLAHDQIYRITRCRKRHCVAATVGETGPKRRRAGSPPNYEFQGNSRHAYGRTQAPVNGTHVPTQVVVSTRRGSKPAGSCLSPFSTIAPRVLPCDRGSAAQTVVFV